MTKAQEIKTLFGAKERAHKRRKHQQAIEKHIHYLIADLLPELTKSHVIISSDRYKRQIVKLLRKIEVDNSSMNDLRIARNYLAKFINDGNKDEKWLLAVPPYIHRVQREKPLRTEKWFKLSKSLNQWVTQWFDALQKRGATEKPLTSEQVLANTLISAAFFGGLCIAEALAALRKQLLEENKPLTQTVETIWIDLTFDSKAQAHNAFINDQSVTLRRWYPDNLTLAWINHFLNLRNTVKTEDVPTAWHLVRQQLTDIDQSCRKIVKSLQQFAECAVGVTEQIEGVRLNQAMVQYLIGKIPSASLPHINHNILFEQPSFSAINNVQDELTRIPAANGLSQSRNHIALASNYERVVTMIRACLSPKQNGSNKNTPKAAIAQLQKLEPNQYPKQLSTLIEWFISLLAENKKVSTVSRYFSAIGKPWLAATATIDIDDLDSQDFEFLYRDILDSQLSEKNRRYMAGRFNQFHLYLSRNHDLPVLTSSLDGTSSHSRPFIRSGFIPEQAFTAFIQSIEKKPVTHRKKQSLQCLYIIAFRCGLRRGELLKLRLQDVESSSERWLFIRNNRYGNNKSSSALRKVPLSVLMTMEEAKLFENYLAYKRALDNSSQALLFSQEQSAHIPLDGNYVSTLAKTLLSQITDFPFIFHHLRHTALSRLQILLEDDNELIKEIISYPEEQIKKIKKTLGGFDNHEVKRDIYWALAGFAGHLTPETTFSNYLHFTDCIVANKLKGAQHTIPINLFKQISGLSSNIITRTIGDKALTENPVDINLFANTLYKRLEKYCQKTCPPETKLDDSDNTQNDNAVYLRPRHSPNPKVCLSVLQAAEQKATMHELVLRFNLEEELINRWLTKAKDIAKLMTSKNKSRIFSRYRAGTPIGEALAPSTPQSNEELQEADLAIDKLRSLYKENKSKINRSINYFINNTNTSKPGILFLSPEELDLYLGILVQVFPKNRWRLKLSPVKNRDASELLKQWKSKSHNIPIAIDTSTVLGKNKYPEGRLTVTLSHPSEGEFKKEYKVSQYSTNVLTYIFHLLWIMI
ncbi:site-specific integrase [Aliiglaciecola sp. NS0011-25]|uniref:site-specific integrase n=1 Tax=Aliiglaciecola sp. NS0011-25 TaxID=3127654 RepID=UPI003106932B